MANPFDQFDAAPAPAAPPPPSRGGNPFDMFDEPARTSAPSLRISDAPSFDDRFGDGPMSSATDASPDLLAQGMRRVADERLVGKPSARNARDAAVLSFGDAFALNAPRNAAAFIQSKRTGEQFETVYRRMKDTEDALSRQYPKTALAGTVGGVVGGAVALPAARITKGADWAGRGVNNIATGALYGAAAEGADKHTVEGAAQGAALGGALGGIGGAALDGGAKVWAAFRRANVPFRDAGGALTEQAASALREAGIDPAAVTPEIEAAFAAKGPSAAVAREAAASEFGIPLSTGQATRDPRALALEGGALAGGRGPRAQGIGQDFASRQAGAIDAARGRLNTMAARSGPEIDNPQAAFEAVADRAQAVGRGYADDVGRAESAQAEALRGVRGSGPADVLDGATTAVQGVRDAAGRKRAAYGQAYDDLDAIEGTFAPDAFASAGRRIRGMLGPETPIAPEVTPAAARALSLIDDMPTVLGLQPGQGPTLQQVGLVRKGISQLYGATGQNGTDRAALGAVREAFERHVQDLTEIGLFRSGPAPRGPAAGFDDAAAQAIEVPPGAIPLPEARQGEPESLVRFLARNGGVPLDAETRAADFNRLYVPGAGALARRNAPTWDQLRVQLSEAGFLPPGGDGYVSAASVRDMVLDAVHSERIGRGARYRLEDEARGGAGRVSERVADQNDDFAVAVDREARRLAIDLEGYGVTGSNLDRAALREAAEARALGRADDGVAAYDDVLARRDDAGEGGVLKTQETPNDAPFPGIGEGGGPAGDGFPAGDSGPADAIRKATGLFAEYKRTFSPRGPGDVAGQRLQRIVERDASPNEAVAMLFGTTTGRIGSGQIQTLGRLRAAVGAESEAWQAVQQSVIARYVDGAPQGLGERLDYLLRGEGRQLASDFLTAEQRAGLGRLRGAVAQTEAARTAAPEWVEGLARGGFDPNRIASSLFGSGVPGARPGAMNEVKAAKGLLGESSAEWSMLRQAALYRLTGDLSANAGRTIAALREFTDGAGSGVARELFSPSEIGQFRRFAAAVHSTLRPDGTAKANSGAAASVAAKALDVLAGAVAFKTMGAGAGLGAYGAKVGQRALVGGVGASRARRSFEGGAPRERLPVPYLPTDRLAIGAGMYAGQR